MWWQHFLESTEILLYEYTNEEFNLSKKAEIKKFWMES